MSEFLDPIKEECKRCGNICGEKSTLFRLHFRKKDGEKLCDYCACEKAKVGTYWYQLSENVLYYTLRFFLWLWEIIIYVANWVFVVFTSIAQLLRTLINMALLGGQIEYLAVVGISVIASLSVLNEYNNMKSDFEGKLTTPYDHDDHDPYNFGDDTLIRELLTVLAFLISLATNSSLNRNKDGVQAFNAFGGELVAIAHMVLNMSPQYKDASLERAARSPIQIKKILDILTVLPEALKHENRGDDDIQELYLNDYDHKPIDELEVYLYDQAAIAKEKNLSGCVTRCVRFCACLNLDKELQDIKGEEQQLRIKFTKLPWAKVYFPQGDQGVTFRANRVYRVTQSIPLVSRLMGMLQGELTSLPNENFGESSLDNAMVKWTALMNNYGTMGDMISYSKPRFFEMIILIFLFVLALVIPFNSYDKSLPQRNEKWDLNGGALTEKFELIAPGSFNFWEGPLTIYFLCMLKCVSKVIGNPFQKKQKGFLTVTNLSRDFTQQLEEIRFTVQKLRLNPFTVMEQDGLIMNTQMVRSVPQRSSFSSSFKW